MSTSGFLTFNLATGIGCQAFCLVLLACNPAPRQTKIAETATKDSLAIQHKPPSGYLDTLWIHQAAAVFYEPDSSQLKAIEARTEDWIFDSSMHEYFYQIRNARIVLKRDWPDIPVLEARHKRYLVFPSQQDALQVIDLDQFDDAYGLFLFRPGRKPEFVDMTNIDQALQFYFGK